MIKNDNWQFGFWILTFVCGTWLAGLTTGVIANDVRYTTKDETILAQSSEKVECLRREIKVDIQKLSDEIFLLSKRQERAIVLLEQLNGKKVTDGNHQR